MEHKITQIVISSISGSAVRVLVKIGSDPEDTPEIRN